MPLSPRAPTLGLVAGVLASLLLPASTNAQTPPTAQEIAAYTGLHAAAAKADAGEIARLAKAGDNLEARDAHGRTPLMVAAFRRDVATARSLIAAGADLNALDRQAYDVITIAAVLPARRPPITSCKGMRSSKRSAMAVMAGAKP